MFCPKCGMDNPNGTQFCAGCGEPFAPPVQPVYQQQNYQQPASAPDSSAKGMAIASMVLGIIALVIPFFGVVCAIVGLILGVLAKKRLEAAGQPTGMAGAGIVTSIIALAIAIACIFLCYVPWWCAASTLSDPNNWGIQ